LPVCPLCNSLAKMKKACPVCGGTMSDEGVIQDFYDNYSPYLDMNIYEDGYRCHDEKNCVHVFSCRHCRAGVSVAVCRIDENDLED